MNAAETLDCGVLPANRACMPEANNDVENGREEEHTERCHQPYSQCWRLPELQSAPCCHRGHQTYP